MTTWNLWLTDIFREVTTNQNKIIVYLETHSEIGIEENLIIGLLRVNQNLNVTLHIINHNTQIKIYYTHFGYVLATVYLVILLL